MSNQEKLPTEEDFRKWLDEINIRSMKKHIVFYTGWHSCKAVISWKEGDEGHHLLGLFRKILLDRGLIHAMSELIEENGDFNISIQAGSLMADRKFEFKIK